MISISEIISNIKASNKVRIAEECSIEDQQIFFIKNVVDAIKGGNVIPVICGDMFEYRNPDGETQSLHSHIVQQVLDNCKKKIELTESELKDVLEDEYYGMRFLEKETSNCRRTPSFQQILFSAVDERACLKKEVKDFLEVCKFPLVITTSCYDVIERELGDLYRSGSYYAKMSGKNDDNDGENAAAKLKVPHTESLPAHCIYHIFGKANSTNPDWGYSDKLIMEYLRFALGDGPWKNLSSAIKTKSLLFVGNSTPDWLFRFMLAPIYGESVYNERTGYYIGSHNSINDGHLFYFLSDICFSEDSNLCSVLGKITEEMKKQNQVEVKATAKKPKIFLSHASENDTTVKKMAEKLNPYFDVFVDFENIDTGNYWAKIIRALRNADYFVPFVTEEFLYKAKKYEYTNELREILSGLNIDKEDFPIDYENGEQMVQVYDLSRKIGGVATELMIAEKCFRELGLSPIDTYSFPIVYYGIAGFNIDLIETKAAAGILPKCLFSSQEMIYYYEDDESDPFKGELDKRFKTNNA